MNEEIKRQLPYTYKVLTKMCDIINIPIPNFEEPDWFLKHTWTEEEQEIFKEWLIQELKNNRGLRFEISRYPHLTSKSIIERLANDFIFNYGWKTNEVKNHD